MTCYCKKCKLEKPPPEDLVSKTAEPANRAPDHAVPDLKKACVGEPQLPRRFDSVPEVRTYILAVLVHKYDLGYDEAKAVADKWHLAMGGRLLDMRRQDLGHIFGDEIGRALRDTISYQTKELKEHRKFVKYVICKFKVEHYLGPVRLLKYDCRFFALVCTFRRWFTAFHV